MQPAAGSHLASQLPLPRPLCGWTFGPACAGACRVARRGAKKRTRNQGGILSWFCPSSGRRLGARGFGSHSKTPPHDAHGDMLIEMPIGGLCWSCAPAFLAGSVGLPRVAAPRCTTMDGAGAHAYGYIFILQGAGDCTRTGSTEGYRAVHFVWEAAR